MGWVCWGHRRLRRRVGIRKLGFGESCWTGRWAGALHDTRLHLLAFWHGVVSPLLTEFGFLSEDNVMLSCCCAATFCVCHCVLPTASRHLVLSEFW